MAGKLFMPAMQGTFGDWNYYSALVTLDDIVERVGYASLLTENSSLGEQIQRRLDDRSRASDIADYLIRNQDRFFNSLVVGVLGGQPEWHPFSLSSQVAEHELGDVTERDQDLVGYLQLSGEETLFALDGQHRLAGIRQALAEQPDLGQEKLSLIFVPHLDTPAGKIRTRSLFISLNKKAVPVNRKDIIILDEVDIAAIITRRLVDSHPHFNGGVIDVTRFGNAIPSSSPFWTTIGTFYDVNDVIIRRFVEGRDEGELEDAGKVRLSEDRLVFYQAGVLDFYDRLARMEPLLSTVFGEDVEQKATALRHARTAENPRLLSRPVGLKIFVNAAAELREGRTVAQTFKELRRVPLSLDRPPFNDIIWDADRARMVVSGQSLSSRLLLYMLGLTNFGERLRQSYADHLGVEPETVRPPRRLPAVRAR
ncbi:DNA sulfur modification protein DndB [Hoeflea alexandrii]|uniref:DNA sulfur modification protein DndB n=1 Tax=Hoeflea alexandrii TaxID=288436 RepID=UPI0022AF7E9E|nr:DNA sulfur modification protein DndB [Hoeflea alexandrii]MCZ4288417.1 DGQHR domain-containing protein [Hoeflea alexandrii]